MNSQRGITLISLIIYIIVMTFAVAAISMITSSFYSNIKEFDGESESAVAYSKFNMYFVNDIKREEVSIEEVFDTYIILSYMNDEGETIKVEYSMQNNSLYRNKVKICDNVDKILISANEDKDKIRVNIKIKDYEKITTYVIENKKNINTNGENTIII